MTYDAWRWTKEKEHKARRLRDKWVRGQISPQLKQGLIAHYEFRRALACLVAQSRGDKRLDAWVQGLKPFLKGETHE